uniref:Uncharacterized protein n=1 Tax=Leersia perrieri TaxID=77586 RepID=A0A0D9W7W8_9ORYZ
MSLLRFLEQQPVSCFMLASGNSSSSSLPLEATSCAATSTCGAAVHKGHESDGVAASRQRLTGYAQVNAASPRRHTRGPRPRPLARSTLRRRSTSSLARGHAAGLVHACVRERQKRPMWPPEKPVCQVRAARCRVQWSFVQETL